VRLERLGTLKKSPHTGTFISLSVGCSLDDSDIPYCYGKEIPGNPSSGPVMSPDYSVLILVTRMKTAKSKHSNIFS
jgi:hypothetical protein